MKVVELAPLAALMGTIVFDGMPKESAVKAYKACREIKKAVKAFEEERAEASKTFKPEGFDALNEKVQTSQPMKPEEVAEYSKLMKEYNDKVADAIKELGDVETELTFEKLTEDEFFALMAANPKWSVNQLTEVESVLLKGE